MLFVLILRYYKEAIMAVNFWMLAAITACAVLNCGAKAQDTKSVESTVEVDSIVLTASIPLRAIAGAAIDLKITVENRSKTEVAFIARGAYWDYEIQVIDNMRRKVPLTRFGKYIYGDSRGIVEQALYERLKPGERIVSKLNVARLFDLSEDGEYEMEVAFHVQHGKKGTALKLNRVRFQLVSESP